MMKKRFEDIRKITAADFVLPSLDTIQKTLKTACRESLDDFLNGAFSEGCWCCLDLDKASGSLFFHIHLPFGLQDDPPVLRVEINHSIIDFIEDRTTVDGDLGDYRQDVEALRGVLLKMVDECDSHLKKTGQ